MQGRGLLAMVLVSAAVAVSGCGSQDGGAPAAQAPVPPGDYVAAVQDLLGPPARMASLATARVASDPEVDAPTQTQVDAMVTQARRELRELRDLPLGDGGVLARQRDALAGAYQATVTWMERVGRDLVQDDRVALRQHLTPLFMSMRGLSSAVSPP